jgi:uncharacterized membrane protein (UPF0182 family)
VLYLLDSIEQTLDITLLQSFLEVELIEGALVVIFKESVSSESFGVSGQIFGFTFSFLVTEVLLYKLVSKAKF